MGALLRLEDIRSSRPLVSDIVVEEFFETEVLPVGGGAFADEDWDADVFEGFQGGAGAILPLFSCASFPFSKLGRTVPVELRPAMSKRSL